MKQTINLEKYKKYLDKTYSEIIQPALSGDIKTIFVCDDLPQNYNAIKRCSYDELQKIQSEGNKLSHQQDACAFFLDKFDNTNHPLISSCIMPLVDILKDETGLIDLSLSNKPMYYRQHNNIDGYMGWHTNSNFPGDRWYFVYNDKQESSFFRYVDTATGEMITKWEPQGWSLNYFELGNRQDPTWHCVYTGSNRFSFGIRRNPLVAKYKFKNIELR